MLLGFCADLPPAWNAAHEKLSTARTLILPSGFACSTANRGHIKHEDRLSSFICCGGVILHFCASSLVSSMSLSDSASSRSSFIRTSFHAAMSFLSALGHLASLASIGVPMPLRTKRQESYAKGCLKNQKFLWQRTFSPEVQWQHVRCL